jgi:PAS domain S-box-containing protein
VLRRWPGALGLTLRRNRALALFEDDFEMRRQPLAPDADATLRLQRISTLLIREGNNDALYEHVLDAAIDLMSADIGSMQLFHPERGELKLLAARGFDPESVAHWEWVRPDSPSSCGMALSAGCRVIVPDIETHEGFARTADLDALRRAGIRAGQSTPLMARSGRLLGMISTHWRRRHRPTERELQPLDVLARQAADLIERNDVETALREREAQLALFVEHAPAGIAMFDDKMRCLAVSRRFVSDHELLDRAEVIGRSVYEIFQDIPARWKEIHVRVLAGEELAHAEDCFPRQDGRMYWVRWSMKPWRSINGRIGGAMLFAEMVNEQVEARRALAESEARFRATFENAAVGIAHLAPDLRWLRANKALCRILGYPVDELVTKSLQDITHPDDLAADLAQVERLLDGEIASYDMDKRYLRKDGSIVWGRLTVGCVREGDGSVDYLVAVVEDISARKAHEEQVHLLMREVNHRAKNMLSLVHAVARQTAAREPEDFIVRFTERIQALAANQDMLVRNEWRGIGVEDLVRGQLAHLGDLMGSRIAVDGPKLCLKATAAQAIGLALHELATNAGKYGSLSVGSGSVDVRWCLDRDVFAMGWSERNGPPVSPPERRGFGSTVVDLMAKRTVDGQVELDYAPSGLVWRLTCPAGNALEAWERRSNFKLDYPLAGPPNVTGITEPF